jgi:hypothetical protein
MKKVETNGDLERLFKTTNFSKGKNGDHVWDRIKLDKIPSDEKEGYSKEDVAFGYRVYVPECSYFGETTICMSSDYEKSGNDALFLQELVRLYRNGRLVVKEKGCAGNPEVERWGM